MTKRQSIPLAPKKIISLLFTVIITVGGTAFAEIQNCDVGDYSKGYWENVYPDGSNPEVCEFPATITSFSGGNLVEGGGYRGYLSLHPVQPCGAAFACPNNNFIYEPPGPVGGNSSLERVCIDADAYGYKFEDGYCYQPTGHPPPDDYVCFFGGGQVLLFLEKWKCYPQPPEPVEINYNIGPPPDICPIP